MESKNTNMAVMEFMEENNRIKHFPQPNLETMGGEDCVHSFFTFLASVNSTKPIIDNETNWVGWGA